MKYLEAHQLKEGEFYHCVTYNDEDIVVQYVGEIYSNPQFKTPSLMFSADLTDYTIRYVLCEKENLREERNKFI